MGDKARLYDEMRPLLRSPKPPDKDGRIWSFCPAHNDGAKHHRRSLSLHPEIGLTCFAGCAFEDILRGLGAAKGRPASPTPIHRQATAEEPDPWAHGTLVAVYQYRDSAGVVHGEKGRFERADGKKTFLWRKPGQDGWKGGLHVRDMPLWGAELVAVADPDQAVVFVEGEKAAEACRARGLLAVTFGGGASSTDFGAALDVLRGRDVLLWPDNDAAGRQYMAHVHGALRPIAASVRTLVIPIALPEKGDAHDFFSLGGTWEQIEEGDLRETAIDYVDKDAITVRVPTPLLPVTLALRDLEVTRRSIEAEIAVSVSAPGFSGQRVQQRVNILSSSQRDALRRDLEAIFGREFGWTGVLVGAFAKARQAIASLSRAVDTFDIEDGTTERFLIDALLPYREHTVLFGEGSSGKTFLALFMACCVALGHSVLGMRSLVGRVLYVDYETNQWTFKRRLRRVLRGLGCVDVLPDNIWYWSGDGIAIADQFEALKAEIARHEISFMVVDSAASACGGDPADLESTMRYCNTLARLPVTPLTLAHVTKEGRSDFPYGSIFWHNHARRTWYVARVQEEESEELNIGLYCKKVNDGSMPRPLGLRLSFPVKDSRDEGYGAVYISETKLMDVPELSAKRPLKAQLIDLLRGGAMSGAELGALTDSDPQTVTRTLRRHPTVFVSLNGDNTGGRGRANLWGLMTR